LPEWLYEEGIGENRAALVEGNDILEAAIEVAGQVLVGTIASARLTSILLPARRGILVLADGSEALLEPLPPALTQGQALTVEIIREPLPEPGRPKLPKARVSAGPERTGPSLIERVEASGLPVVRLPVHGPDRLEQVGWSELMEEARTGEIAFPGGALRMALTPAMTLFDVDGALEPSELAIAGAAAGGRAIRRHGIGGSIGIDLPTLPGRSDRQAAAAALDAALPQPFERTAVNGFGFLQVVRRRERVSIPELLQSDPAGAAARQLLRQAERRTGGVTLAAAPVVAARLRTQEGWIAALERRIGGPVQLREDTALPMFGGYVHGRQI
jgi:hypothetical protein